MTIQDQIDQLKKEFEDIKNIIVATHKGVDNYKYSITGGPVVKPTRYYPNGAYMDEPEEGTSIFYVYEDGKIHLERWVGVVTDYALLKNQRLFPTEESCKKDKRRDDLTAKMYRDMRDERINGDWVADWEGDSLSKYVPYFSSKRGLYNLREFDINSHDFYYKNETFIEDLKALGWTEEELKIVWFRV